MTGKGRGKKKFSVGLQNKFGKNIIKQNCRILIIFLSPSKAEIYVGDLDPIKPLG